MGRSTGTVNESPRPACTGTRTRRPASRDNQAPVAITAVSAVSGSPLRGYTVMPLPEVSRH